MQGGVRMKRERNAVMVRRWKAGASCSDIAEEQGISRQYVSRVLRRAGHKPAQGCPRGRRLPDMTDHERWEYEKLRRLLGAKAARQEMFKGIGALALLSDPRYVDLAWEAMCRGME
jgi:predicted transcriptional regulator